jgi:hypothetical protein
MIKPELKVVVRDGERVDEEEDDTPAGWPKPLGNAAYHGLAGTIVRAIEPD